MTREQAKQAAEIMLAYADRKDIEFRKIGETYWECVGEFDVADMAFEFKNFEYRIKQEPTYRPFKNKEECWNEMLKHQPFMWVVSAAAFMRVVEVNLEGIFLTNSSHLWYYERAFEDLKFVDGTPFGIKEG